MRHTLILALAFLFYYQSVCGQSNRSGLLVEIDGYFINSGGLKIFQPAQSDSNTVWSALDNRSYQLFEFYQTNYLNAVENIGDSIQVRCFDTDEQRDCNIMVSYFYCSLLVDLMVLDTTSFKIFNSPKYWIYYKDKRYPLWSVNIDNRVHKILPKDLNHLIAMKKYYNDKGMVVPEWLTDELNCRLSVAPSKRKDRR